MKCSCGGALKLCDTGQKIGSNTGDIVGNVVGGGMICWSTLAVGLFATALVPPVGGPTFFGALVASFAAKSAGGIAGTAVDFCVGAYSCESCGKQVRRR